MPILATSTTKVPVEPVEAGSYVARLYQIIDLGTVRFDYMGEAKHLRKVRLGFELPTETKVFKEENGEQPYVVSGEYTLSTHEKSKLTPLITALNGKPLTEQERMEFDIEHLIGKACILNIVHNEGKNGYLYANIDSATPLLKGSTCPPAVNKPVLLSFTNFDTALFESLPEFIKEKIKQSPEYISLTSPNGKIDPNAEINIDDIPF